MGPQVIRVYCDCSLSKTLKLYGVAASYVYDESVLVRSKKVYELTPHLNSTVGELQAILYAIQQSGSVLRAATNQPDSVIVFTDLSAIDHLLDIGGDFAFEKCIQRIAEAQSSFAKNWSTVSQEIRYLPPDEQRYNPFYASAHNAARREASLGR